MYLSQACTRNAWAETGHGFAGNNQRFRDLRLEFFGRDIHGLSRRKKVRV